MAAPRVIVFGPTGGVGSAAALTAHELGAHVALAMRDTTKAIPGLTADAEKQGRYERVQADLQQPQTVHDAITKTQAKHAFVYVAFQSPDHMKATMQALKSAGVELVVLLSSFTIRGNLEDIPPAEVIPWVHARVEMTLHEVFGADKFVALRPGSFATNSLQYKAGLQSGHVKLLGPDITVDGIAPEDIGRVGGTVLVKGPPQDGNRTPYLYAPTLLTHLECVKIMAKIAGKDPKIEALSREDAYKMFTEERGMPPPLADFMARHGSAVIPPGSRQVFVYPVTEEELNHVEKYTGKKGMTFAEWAEKNKQLFAS